MREGAFSETSSFNLPVEGLPNASLYAPHAQESTPLMPLMLMMKLTVVLLMTLMMMAVMMMTVMMMTLMMMTVMMITQRFLIRPPRPRKYAADANDS